MIGVDWLQWPAMLITLIASWMVASHQERRRHWGFWIFLASNALWVVWGIAAHAWALIALQFGLSVMNIRGLDRNKSESVGNPTAAAHPGL